MHTKSMFQKPPHIEVFQKTFQIEHAPIKSNLNTPVVVDRLLGMGREGCAESVISGVDGWVGGSGAICCDNL